MGGEERTFQPLKTSYRLAWPSTGLSLSWHHPTSFTGREVLKLTYFIEIQVKIWIRHYIISEQKRSIFNHPSFWKKRKQWCHPVNFSGAWVGWMWFASKSPVLGTWLPSLASPPPSLCPTMPQKSIFIPQLSWPLPWKPCPKGSSGWVLPRFPSSG